MQDDDELSRPIGGVIEDVYITAPVSRGGDGITVYGSDGPVVIRNCTVDLGRWPLDKLDEGISGVGGACAVIHGTRVTRVGKAVLWGNGEFPEADAARGELVLEDCIIRDFGRRAPEAQDGVRVIMRRCVIRNWGISSRFTVRSFGAWAHDGAHSPACRIVSCRPGCGALWSIWPTGSDGDSIGGTGTRCTGFCRVFAGGSPPVRRERSAPVVVGRIAGGSGCRGIEAPGCPKRRPWPLWWISKAG